MPEPWPPHDSLVPTEIVQRVFQVPPGRGYRYSFAVCRLCGTTNYESRGTLEDKEAPNEMVPPTWLESADECVRCRGVRERYPEIALWVDQILTFVRSLLLARIDQHEQAPDAGAGLGPHHARLG